MLTYAHIHTHMCPQVLTHGDTVAMGLKEFSELISLVKPGLSEEIILILFRELDDDHTDNIRPKEFLNLCDVLSYSIQYTKGFIPVLRPAPTPAGACTPHTTHHTRDTVLCTSCIRGVSCAMEVSEEVYIDVHCAYASECLF